MRQDNRRLQLKIEQQKNGSEYRTGNGQESPAVYGATLLVVSVVSSQITKANGADFTNGLCCFSAESERQQRVTEEDKHAKPPRGDAGSSACEASGDIGEAGPIS